MIMQVPICLTPYMKLCMCRNWIHHNYIYCALYFKIWIRTKQKTDEELDIANIFDCFALVSILEKPGLEYWKPGIYIYAIWHLLLFTCCILCICLESRQCHKVFMDYVSSNVTKYILRSDVFAYLSALGHQSTYHSLFIDLYNGCDYLCMLGFKLNRVNKRVPIVPLSTYWFNELYTQS